MKYYLLQFAFLEVIVGVIEEERNFFGKYTKDIPKHLNRLLVALAVITFGVIYCFGSGYCVLQIVDTFGTVITLMATNLINCIFFCNIFLILTKSY